MNDHPILETLTLRRAESVPLGRLAPWPNRFSPVRRATPPNHPTPFPVPSDPKGAARIIMAPRGPLAARRMRAIVDGERAATWRLPPRATATPGAEVARPSIGPPAGRAAFQQRTAEATHRPPSTRDLPGSCSSWAPTRSGPTQSTIAAMGSQTLPRLLIASDDPRQGHRKHPRARNKPPPRRKS